MAMVSVGSLPIDMQQLLADLADDAGVSLPDQLPLRRAALTAFPEVTIGVGGSDDRNEDYVRAMAGCVLPPLLVADGILIDGRHRIAHLRDSGALEAAYIDLTAVGKWPAEAFRASAETAYDMATHTFACHSAGAANPRLCAGFLLRGADHNMRVRLDRMHDLVSDDVDDGGHVLHASYVAMAVANGVPSDDPALQACRESYYEVQQRQHKKDDRD